MSSARSTPSRLSPQLNLLEPAVRGLILDIDGVLWKEAEPIGDLAAVFRTISAMGLAVTVATNNAMRTVEEYRLKLHGFGVDLEPRQIITSAEATADTLAAAIPRGGTLFVVGEHGLIDALRRRGFDVVTDPNAEDDFAAVVAGIDHEFSYPKLQKAATLIRGGALFYGTNPDRTFPTPTGLVPGAGAVLAAIASAADKEPIVVGKPSPLLFEIAAERMHLDVESLLVVGDRLETDIAGGRAFGARTALVLSGVSTLDQARAWRPSPTLVVPSLSDLVGV